MARHSMAALLLAACMLLAGGPSAEARELLEVPHVSECATCKSCAVDGTPPLRPADLGLKLLLSKKAEELLAPQKRGRKQCEECRGCNAELEYMGGKVMDVGNGVTYNMTDHGRNAHSRLFWVKVQNAGRTDEYITKFDFDPEAGPGSESFEALSRKGDQFVKNIQLQLGVLKLAEDCGTDDIYVQSWFAPVVALLPGSDVIVHVNTLFMTPARGVKLGDLGRTPAKIAQPIADNINSTQVLSTAIMDLLTRQCDRHGDNIFLSPEGNLQLIDNEHQFVTTPHRFNSYCSYNSLFITGCRIHLHSHTSYRPMVSQKKRLANMGCEAVPMPPAALLDYRCHVIGGAIGTWNYPPKAKKCLEYVAGATSEDLMDKYALHSAEMARNLRTRAKEMVTQGFEWTLANSAPLNADHFFGPIELQPCCHIHWPEDGGLPHCSTCWRRNVPWTGPGDC